MRLLSTGLLSVALLVLAVEPTLGQSDWQQFLGPNRDGISSESDLVSELPAGGVDVRWRVPGGVGMSAVAVSGNHAITMWNSAKGQVVVSLDAKTGKTNWTTPVSANYKNGQGDGPRGTPAIVDDMVYAYTGEGVLACLDIKSGKIVWSENLPAASGVRPAEYGMACSPLIVEDLVVVTVGGKGSAVVALNRSNGKRVWSAGSGTPGYSSPALLEVGGQKQIVAFTGAGAIGIEPSSGTEHWSYPFKTPYDCNTATPIAVDGKVFLSAGENHGCVMLQLDKRGSRWIPSESWQSVDVKSVMRNEWQTSIHLDGYLYGFDNVGSAGPTTHLTCVNAEDGSVAWRKTRFGKGNLVAADGRLWITTMSGELVVVKATPEEFVELGRQKLFGKTRQNLSLADGHAFIRDDREVICVSLSK